MRNRTYLQLQESVHFLRIFCYIMSQEVRPMEIYANVQSSCFQVWKMNSCRYRIGWRASSQGLDYILERIINSTGRLAWHGKRQPLGIMVVLNDGTGLGFSLSRPLGWSVCLNV